MPLSRTETTAQGIESVLSEWVRTAVHTALPGIIDTVDMQARRARVRIALEAVLTDGTCFERAPLLDVPLIFPAGAGGLILIHLQRGDAVWIMFSERGLEEWKESFELSEPMPHQVFGQSDAVAMAGFGPYGNVALAAENGVLIQTQDASVHIHVGADGITLDVPDGSFVRLGANASQRLLTETFLNHFNGHTHTFGNAITTDPPNEQADDTMMTTKARGA